MSGEYAEDPTLSGNKVIVGFEPSRKSQKRKGLEPYTAVNGRVSAKLSPLPLVISEIFVLKAR